MVGLLLVGLYITATYWFTASTSFANPAVTIARALSNSFAGIAPTSASAFIAAQLAGAVVGFAIVGWLFRAAPNHLRAPSPSLCRCLACAAEHPSRVASHIRKPRAGIAALQLANFASSVMSAFSSFETGHPALAVAASFSNVA